MALIITKTTRLGRKNAFVNVLGLCTATYVHETFSIPKCISAHSQQQNTIFLVKFMGGSTLLYMGFKSIKSGKHSLNSKQYQRMKRVLLVKQNFSPAIWTVF
ncbi:MULTISPECIES: hypothetical protein [unclassified Bartonella]|uniref:hypothetical protein n=1 Tax=unclassified Bartonella TaxID=2645622 RepID=UPI0035CE8746